MVCHLEAYSSSILDLSPSLKDDEMEYAMLFSERNNTVRGDNRSILMLSNVRLIIFSEATPIAICSMQYCKVLKGIVESVLAQSYSDDRDRAVR